MARGHEDELQLPQLRSPRRRRLTSTQRWLRERRRQAPTNSRSRSSETCRVALPAFRTAANCVWSTFVGIDDSVGALRRTGSHLSQFPANEVSGPGAIGVNPAVMRVDPLDLQGRVSCRLTRLHRCNCRLSMNGN